MTDLFFTSEVKQASMERPYSGGNMTQTVRKRLEEKMQCWIRVFVQVNLTKDMLDSCAAIAHSHPADSR